MKLQELIKTLQKLQRQLGPDTEVLTQLYSDLTRLEEPPKALEVIKHPNIPERWETISVLAWKHEPSECDFSEGYCRKNHSDHPEMPPRITVVFFDGN